MENFKSFGQNVEIPMAPITLILGQNSAGKSSILQALYLLKQSYEVPHQSANDTLKPRVERGIVDFGSIPELLFDHDTSRTLKIRVLFDKEGHADESIFPHPGGTNGTGKVSAYQENHGGWHALWIFNQRENNKPVPVRSV